MTTQCDRTAGFYFGFTVRATPYGCLHQSSRLAVSSTGKKVNYHS